MNILVSILLYTPKQKNSEIYLIYFEFNLGFAETSDS